ncbi:MAG: ABC transporter permease subunit [Spirochaetales bacterium]|nr:ABC transporter permease subunit [Spirochaetales bacterium]
MKRSRIEGSIIWFAALLGLWEIVSRSGLVSQLIMPPVTVILRSFAFEWGSGELEISMLLSLGFVFAGISAGGIGAFIISALSFQFDAVKRLSGMLTAVLHPLPGIALLPVFILFFGIGRITLLVVIIHSVIWPLIINISAGFTSVPAVYRRIGSNYGLKSAAFFFRIMVPASFPHILSGLKTAWARAWRAAVSAEMVFGITGSGGGLGWFVYNKRIFMDTPGMYAGILMLAILGIIVESGLFNLIENKTVRRWGVSV